MNSRRYPHWTGEYGFRAGLGERISDLGYDRIWSAQHIGACESEQPDIGQEQPILAAVVLDQAGAMGLAVIFKTKTVLAVVEVRAT